MIFSPNLPGCLALILGLGTTTALDVWPSKVLGAQEQAGTFFVAWANNSAPEDCVVEPGTKVADTCCTVDYPVPLRSVSNPNTCQVISGFLPEGQGLISYQNCEGGVETYGEACYNGGANGGLIPGELLSSVQSTNASTLEACGSDGCQFAVRGKGCWKIRDLSDLPGLSGTDQVFLFLDDPFCFRELVPVKDSGKVSVMNAFAFNAPEAVVDVAGPVEISDDAVEFDLFPLGAFYEIDVTSTSLTMTVKDISRAQITMYPEGITDSYYFDLGREIASASLVSDESYALNEFAEVALLPPGTSVDVTNAFYSGIVVPFEVVNGGVSVKIGPGSDISMVGAKLKLDYTMKEEELTSATSCWPVAMSLLAAAVFGISWI